MRPRSLFLFLVLLISTAHAHAQPFTFTRFAGTSGGVGYEDGAVPELRLSPDGVAVGRDGTLYVVELTHHTIRQISGGVSTTIAGLAGVKGSTDGIGAAARFSFPASIAVDDDDNLYVVDRGNHTIRRIAAGTRRVTTLAGLAGAHGNSDGVGAAARFDSPIGIDVAADGNVYVADTDNHIIRKITPDGTVTTIAGGAGVFSSPYDVAVDDSGNVYVADTMNARIRKIAPDGVVSTIAGLAGSPGQSDGTGAAARFQLPVGVAVGAGGMLYVADTSHTIREIDAAGTVRTIAGAPKTSGAADGAGSAARFWVPADLDADGTGNLFVVDANNESIRKVTPAGVVTTVAGAPPLTGADNGPRLAATFHFPAAAAVDGSGNVYVADRNNHVIRRIDAAGNVTTFAGAVAQRGDQNGIGSAARFDTPLGIATDAQGNVYVADSGNEAIRKITPSGTVTTLPASFFLPFAVAVAPTGEIYVADRLMHAIQRIDTSGGVTVLTGGFFHPEGVAVDGHGNVYVADTGNDAVRKISSSGVVSTLASNFNMPTSVAVDAEGNVFVVDTSNHTIHKIASDGTMTTIGGRAGFIATSEGTGDVARFQFPQGIAFDAAGNLYVADRQNHRIMKGSPAIADAATIDAANGRTGETRQLNASGASATSWQWEIVRRPRGSIAQLSSSSIRNPTFTPDAADLYVFRLTASGPAGVSITDVSLDASVRSIGRRRSARH